MKYIFNTLPRANPSLALHNICKETDVEYTVREFYDSMNYVQQAAVKYLLGAAVSEKPTIKNTKVISNQSSETCRSSGSTYMYNGKTYTSNKDNGECDKIMDNPTLCIDFNNFNGTLGIRPAYEKIVQDISKVIFSGPMTIVFFADGTKEMVRRANDAVDDREAAILWCVAKHMYPKQLKKGLSKLVDEATKNQKKHESID